MSFPPPSVPILPSLSDREDDFLHDSQLWQSDLMMYEEFPPFSYDDHGVNSGNVVNEWSQDTSEEDKSLIRQYEDRFLQLFAEYAHDNRIQVDQIAWNNDVLLVLCMKHVVLFLTWIRRNNSQLQNVKNLLLNNTDLRPEVRNGLLMILIHTFAAVKVKYANQLIRSELQHHEGGNTIKLNHHEENMITILHHPVQGLNIAFQYIFKIVHDRNQFIAFLKNVILGLIEMNLIPKNTRKTVSLNEDNSLSNPRLNQSDEMQAENQEEFQAFLALQSWLLTEFEDSKNERKLQEAKKSIQRICSYWAMHSKTLKANRFQHAMKLLGSAPTPTFTLVEPSPVDNSGRFQILPEESSEQLQPNVLLSCVQPAMKKRKAESPTTPSLAVPSSAVISVFRFERHGVSTWFVKQHLIYDLSHFLDNMQQSAWSFYSSYLYAINSQQLQEMCTSSISHYLIDTQRENVESWLKRNKLLVRSWSTDERAQVLKEFDEPALTQSGLQLGIAYEFNVRLVICIRSNSSIGLQSDLWTFLYPLDLRDEIGTASNVEELFVNLFPNLARLFRQAKNNIPSSQIMVKYHHRPLDSIPIPASNSSAAGLAWQLPVAAATKAFQVIGTSSMDSKKFIAKLQHGCVLHDFLLEALL